MQRRTTTGSRTRTRVPVTTCAALMTALDLVLERLEKVRKRGERWSACCPAHADRHPSLSVGVGHEGKVLLKCFAGCRVEDIVRALGLEVSALFDDQRGGPSPSGGRQGRQADQVGPRLVAVGGKLVDPTPGLTVEELAAAKRLPVELLSELGVGTVNYFGPPAVQVPYIDESGEIAGIRYRLSLAREPRFRWKKGTKAASLLYGASRLRDAQEAGFVLLVEGESDAWTLIHHGLPVVALPGASMWSEEHAQRLDGVETVFAVIEPGEGGDTLLDSLRHSVIRPRVRAVRLPAKDVSELHVLDATTFVDRLRMAMDEATTLLDLEGEHRREQAASEWEHCRELARKDNILLALAIKLRARGFVGSLKTPKLVYLVLTSRLLRRPVSLVLRGLSSVGKSYTVECVVVFFPQSAYFNRSGMSERALVYSDESFEHRIICIAEAEALAGEGQGAYFLRTLISENRLIYETVEKDGDRFVARLIEKPGPTGVILTTTRLRLDPEVETRLLALTVPDDPALTREIMRSIARRTDDTLDDEQDEAWLALQRWLEVGGERRVIDQDGFLLALAERIPVVAVRLRRDFALIRSLVFAHAILHQATRPRDEHGRVLATLDDYEAVRDLIAGIIAEGIGATVSDDVRETVAAVQSALEANPGESAVKRAQIQAELGLDDRATNRRLMQASEAGFVENTNPGRGKIGLYKVGSSIPDGVDVLPSAGELRLDLGNLDKLVPAEGHSAPSPFWASRNFLSACTTRSRPESSPRTSGMRRTGHTALSWRTSRWAIRFGLRRPSSSAATAGSAHADTRSLSPADDHAGEDARLAARAVLPVLRAGVPTHDGGRVSESVLCTAERLAAQHGCPLVAAARHPEHRTELMGLNAELERTAVSGTAEARVRVQKALEDVLRARVRGARRAA